MHTAQMSDSLKSLFSELVDGTPESGGFMLNTGDPGLNRSLERLPASAASAISTGGSSIAAHVEHLRYGLSLMNRWSDGENPFAGADWGAAWQKTTVSESEWKKLRNDLRAETERWLAALGTARDVDEMELRGMIGSIAHLAYHVGAIRQIDRSARGPAS